jgi:hypothetical protein
MHTDPYAHFLVRDQDGDSRHTLGLLQGWGGATRGRWLARLGKAVAWLGWKLVGHQPSRRMPHGPVAQCGIR